ncbi:helix-turn-helix domain-containing protein [Rhodobacter sphaeroides]|uniref:helix-turn-helix domain-containing protein n=1 Tax=Cereibacter sphaeroides TaxID=1063 RepID=UPI0013247721|nr:helix-turn-helix transcriptional regulator [Cereibacter sphaeroides]MWP36167.1 helix-turn-helix domain-containing protein [Cereibacter sphaeroides]
MAMDNQDWFSNETATFGDRLAGAREAAGLTQEEMARRLGVRLKTLQSWEDDLAEPRANRLQMMAGMLNVSLRWLLTGEGEGAEGPSEPAILTSEGREALAELARMRTQMLALAQEMGQLEKRMRALLRKEAE